MINGKLNYFLNYVEVGDIRHVIAKYMKKHMQDMPHTPINKIANECHVSKGMIMKFVHELGYDSYIDLKEDCASYLTYIQENHKEQDYHYYIQTMNCQINDLSLYIDFEKLYIWADMIKHCRCLYLYGDVLTKPILLKLQYQLDTLFLPGVIISEGIKKHYEIKESSLFLVFRISEDEHLKRTIKSFEKYHCEILEITNDSESRYDHFYFPCDDEAALINFLFIFIDLITMIIKNELL
ncbi:MAG: hypothetical protein LUG46_06260 [Erysipelotrichaceae bacterium]|nr:hypothetical protein [Erysipelotrichaceae bacterium]